MTSGPWCLPIPNEGLSNTCGALAKANWRKFSPRLHDWEHRRRLLLLASLAYAFLLELMQPPWEGTRDWIMHFWCRRTGTWTHQTLVPFTRLRTALSQLWLAFPPTMVLPGRSSLGVALRLLQ